MVAPFDFLGDDKRFVAFPVLGYLLVDVECSETSVVIYSEAVLEVKIDVFIASVVYVDAVLRLYVLRLPVWGYSYFYIFVGED